MNPELVDSASLASQLALGNPCFFLTVVGIAGGLPRPPRMCGYWGSKLQSFARAANTFTLQAIAPAPVSEVFV